MWQILSSFLRCIVYNRVKTETIYQIQRLWKLMPICDTSHVSFCQNCECIFVYSVVYIVVLRTIIYDKAIIWFCVMIECLCLRLFTVKCGFLGILTSTTTKGHLPPIPLLLNRTQFMVCLSTYTWSKPMHFCFIAENCIGLKEVYKEF